MREHVDEILSEMFADYVNSGYKKVHVISPPDRNANYTTEDVVKYMSDMGYVKMPMYRPGNVTCMLDTGGIEHIEPSYFDNHIMTVLEYFYRTNTRQNISAILQFPKEHLERSMEIGAVMERRRLIQAVQATHSGYVAEISAHGRIHYEDNQAEFLDLK